EALLGYLFLEKKEERLSQLVAEAIQFGTSGRKTNESAT
ncbi:mini-ribonuclease 3, partial [Enterococcus faecalis]